MTIDSIASVYPAPAATIPPANPSPPGLTGFSAHKNSTDQPGIANDSYTLVSFAATKFDTGVEFTPGSNAQLDVGHSKWVPVPVGAAPRIVSMYGQVWISAGAATSGNPQFVAKVVKNAVLDGGGHEMIGVGTDIEAGIGATGTVPGTAPIPFSMVDEAQDGDYYQVFLYATGATGSPPTCTIDGNPAHTWFSGLAF